MVDYYKKLIQRIKCPRIFECPLNGEMSSCNRCQKNIKEEAACAIGELLNNLKAADADNKRWKQICEAQNERIDELEKRLDGAE